MKEFIESRCEKLTESGCWIWMKSTQQTGYGGFRKDGKHHYAHRASYEAFNGLIPEGMHVLHHCDVRACCNPGHLFTGTNLDNINDSMNKGRRKGVKRNRPSGLKYKPQDLINYKGRKISLDQNDEVKRIRKETGLSYEKIGVIYGVSGGTILRIIRGNYDY